MEGETCANSDCTRQIWREGTTFLMIGILTVPTRWFWDGTLIDFHSMRFKKDPVIALDTKLRRTRLVVFNDGYVVLCTQNRRRGAESLNTFFLALSLVTGRTAESITERSVEDVEMSQGGRSRKRWSMIQLANFLETYPECAIPGHETMHTRKELEVNLRASVFSTEELRLAVILANRFLESDRPAVVAQHLETIGHFVTGDWMASSLIGWITVEQAIDHELVLHLIREGQPVSRAKETVRDMTEHRVLKELMRRRPSPLGRRDPTVLTKEKLRRIHGLKGLRNSIAHGEKRATERDALRMKKVSEMAMWRMFRHNQFNYGELFKSIRAANKAREERLWRLPTP